MPEKIKIVIILGPTAAGKSDFGVTLAKKFKGEIISADSRQVYRGMDIGSGKITQGEMRGVRHWMLDIASPRGKNYNAAKFQKDALKKIQEIQKSGQVPFLVGGTGFWIDSIALNKTFPNVKPDIKLREKLAALPTTTLFRNLEKLDPLRATSIDKHNRVRLIRALEIALSLKNPAKPAKSTQPTKNKFIIEPLLIGLDMPSEKLFHRIEKRLDQRIKSGMIEEVNSLHRQGISWKKLEEFGLEYRFIAQYLQKKISAEKMHELLGYAIKHYAGRQRTWFKRNPAIIWLDPTKKTSLKRAESAIKNFLAKN